MAPKSKKSEYPAFTNFTIKVEVRERSWPSTVTRILNSVEGVTNFKMEDNGKINISGYIEPKVLLKCLRKAGKSAQLVHWQYGECSNNMYVKKTEPSTNKNANVNGAYGYGLYPPGDGGYNGYYGYPRHERNFGYNQLEYAAGNCSDCNGHHIEKPKTPEKPPAATSSSTTTSSAVVPQELSSTRSCGNGCSLM